MAMSDMILMATRDLSFAELVSPVLPWDTFRRSRNWEDEKSGSSSSVLQSIQTELKRSWKAIPIQARRTSLWNELLLELVIQQMAQCRLC